jgi:serine phosphatase RsbU (regulator of sigma subunit)
LALLIYMFPRWRKTATSGEQQRPLLTMTILALFGAVTIGGAASLSAMFQLGPNIPLIILGVWLVLLGFSFLFIVVYYPIAAFSAFVRSYRQSGVEEKRQVRWPLLAAIIAIGSPVALGIVWLAHYFIFRREPDALLMMLGDLCKNGIYLFIPIAFAFAILKYRLMDIDLIIKKTIIYSAVTGLIVLLFLGLVGGLGGFLVQYAGLQNQWMIVFSTLVVALIFVPVRNRVQDFVDRRFFRKKYDYPTVLKTLSREISQAVDQHAMLKLVVEQLQPALQNRSVVIFSRGTYDRAYVATAKVGLPDEIIGQLKFEVDSRLLTMMLSTFEVHPQDLPEAEKHTLRKAGSAFIVPVKLKNELIAFISLGTKLSDEDYDAEDKDFLTSVAEQMAISFDRIRLREQERDFEKAREIQQGLLPKQIPQLPGYEIACAWQPARAVAGDYYDVIKLSENALGICIADVVGKGMPAALLMSNLQAIVRAMASENMPPKQLCEKVGRVVSSNMTPDKFITFFYCLLDAKNKKLVYTNAGHNRPILIHQDGSWIELKEGGLALGISRERTYEQGETELKSGARLLLFTDGVTEAMNAEGDEFGETRLLELLGGNRKLSAVELQKSVMAAVADFTGGAFQDDVTMLVIGVD